MDSPNLLEVAWRIVRALVRTERPQPTGDGMVVHSGFQPALDSLARGGIPGLLGSAGGLESYVTDMESVAPNDLSRREALAFWLNLYNARAMDLALRAFQAGKSTVLRVPGGFAESVVTVADERLSLDDIEHGKIRRFGDPRIHGALVCGALSCPTLRDEPYAGDRLDQQLDDQMKVFLAGGGAAVGSGGSIALSRVFLWYGADFVRPHRMPTVRPVGHAAVLRSLSRWLPDHMRGPRKVMFQDYDWGLACKVA